MHNTYICLNKRNIIKISGSDKKDFLQGLVTNDIKKVSPDQAIYALMLTPQGKFLYDFFILEKDGDFFIDCPAEKLEEIIKKLSMYKLRSDVTIENLSEKYEAVALLGEKVFDITENDNEGYVHQFCKGAAYIDPRSKNLYARAIIERENQYQSFKAYDFEKGEISEYENLRIKNCIPSGESDMESGNSFPLDYGMEELNAIDYQKGCYVGQEVTARVHHRGTIKKKPYLIEFENETPPSGTEVKSGERKLGKICSSSDHFSLALLRIEDTEKYGPKVESDGLEGIIKKG